jgi:hypothetical protein
MFLMDSQVDGYCLQDRKILENTQIPMDGNDFGHLDNSILGYMVRLA